MSLLQRNYRIEIPLQQCHLMAAIWTGKTIFALSAYFICIFLHIYLIFIITTSILVWYQYPYRKETFQRIKEELHVLSLIIMLTAMISEKAQTPTQDISTNCKWKLSRWCFFSTRLLCSGFQKIFQFNIPLNSICDFVLKQI